MQYYLALVVEEAEEAEPVQGTQTPSLSLQWHLLFSEEMVVVLSLVWAYTALLEAVAARKVAAAVRQMTKRWKEHSAIP